MISCDDLNACSLAWCIGLDCLFSLLGLGWLWGAVCFFFFFLLEGLRRNYCFLFHCGNWGWSLGWVFCCHFGAVSSLHARSFAWGWCLWPVGCGGKGALFATSVSASLKTFLIDTFLKVFWGIFSQIKVLKTKKNVSLYSNCWGSLSLTRNFLWLFPAPLVSPSCLSDLALPVPGTACSPRSRIGALANTPFHQHEEFGLSTSSSALNPKSPSCF